MSHPEYASIAQKLKTELFSELKKQGDLWMEGRGEEYEQHPYMKPNFGNFYQDVLDGKLDPLRPRHYLMDIQ